MPTPIRAHINTLKVEGRWWAMHASDGRTSGNGFIDLGEWHVFVLYSGCGARGDDTTAEVEREACRSRLIFAEIVGGK